MKRLLLIVLILLFSTIVWASPPTRVVWDESPEADAAGYYLYYGESTRVYPNAIKIEGKTNNCYMLDALPLADGIKYYITVTAYDINNLESDYSNEVIYPVLEPVNISMQDNGQTTTITVVIPNCSK